MSDNPLITIITVTFNAGKVIERTLSSLRHQSYQDFEHIIIDGDSKDDTLRIIKGKGSPQTKVYSEPDKGLYDAMNKGLKKAKGKYILYLNAGDAFHNHDSLADYVSYALKDANIIYGDTDIVDPTGLKISGRHLSVPKKLTKESFSNGMLICHQAFMVKKSLAPNYNLNYKFSADFDWCIRCIENSASEGCFNLDKVVIDYLSDGLTDKNKWKSLKERFDIMKLHYGLPKTLFKHIGFVFRALRRGKI